ncbi:ATP-binding protein [Pseudopedobacter beijingensis]|uniref:histidine kinase n=1 Tax=Pseudopedobacter beijingensis TaxID=1207056 RepID=A0ABW4IJ85_9SPHI
MLKKLGPWFLILFFCCSFTSAFSYNDSEVYAQKGILDLRKEDFSNNLKIKGQWLFYWNKLVDSVDSFPSGGYLVDFPLRWTSFKIKDRTFPSFGYATYMVRLLLPNDSAAYTILVPPTYSSYKLFINNHLVAKSGEVTRSPAGFVPHFQTKLVDLTSTKDTLLLTLQVANYTHSKGGTMDPLLIGLTDHIELKKSRNDAILLTLTGCLIMGGLFFLALFLVGRRDHAILFFALFSILYSYRIIGTESYPLHSLFPDLSWFLAIRLEYLSLFLSIGLFTLYNRFLFPLDVNKYIVRTVVAVCISFSLASVFLSPFIFTQLITPFLIVSVFCLTYTPYVYLLAYKRKRPGSIYTISSTLVLLLIFSLTILRYWRIIDHYQVLSFFGYISIFFLQSLALSHRVSFVLKSAKREAETGLIAKSEFLSTMSHEIRTPLNSVIGVTHLLLKNNPRKDQKEQLDVMLFSANNLLAIVNDILDYSKIEAGKISFENIEMDIAKLAHNLMSAQGSFADDKGIDLRLSLDKALSLHLKGDPTRLHQVLSNLLHNALKFTQKGFVELGIEVKNTNKNTQTLYFYVKDSGIGISREKQDIIFDRFTQADSSTSRSFGGTGLGLAICKRILELQHAELGLDSEENKGSTFFFTQTFEKAAVSEKSLSATQNIFDKQQDLEGVHVLLVEDNIMNVYIAKAFLEKWGAIIDVATNGKESLEKLDVDKHQLILMDLHMPVMDGYEATKHMRKMGVKLPIIALTANLPADVEYELKSAEMDDIVVKPFLPEELQNKVLKYIRKK